MRKGVEVVRQGRGVNFLRFCTNYFYGRPLTFTLKNGLSTSIDLIVSNGVLLLIISILLYSAGTGTCVIH